MNTQKYNHTLVWSDKMVKDFQTLNDAFAKAPICAAPDFDSGEKLILTTNYSFGSCGLGPQLSATGTGMLEG